MNAKVSSPSRMSKFQQILFALLVLVLLIASTATAPVHAAGSSVGFIDTSVICLAGQYRFSPGFVGTYDGQWVYFRLWVFNNSTRVYNATGWQYIQAYTNGSSPSLYQSATSGQIISIKTEAYFYNNTAKTWEYAGIKYANHWQLTVYGSPLTSCKIY